MQLYDCKEIIPKYVSVHWLIKKMLPSDSLKFFDCRH